MTDDTESDDDDKATGLEMARCAEINFQNFARAFPGGVTHHPFFKISMMQLRAAIERLEEEQG